MEIGATGGDEIKNNQYNARVTTLRKHQIELKDSLVNPFENASY